MNADVDGQTNEPNRKNPTAHRLLETTAGKNEHNYVKVEALARRIATARKRIRAILRRARRLTHAALADAGRGVVVMLRDWRPDGLSQQVRSMRERRLPGSSPGRNALPRPSSCAASIWPPAVPSAPC